ncbi:MAG TPA: aminotransferase class I/II-fold pyridoxal phosphate-dependent enzyme [Elusimicrobiota bacterium]|jgi:aspartate/methionine/tyrosine aminotransferase|nr:aminotransferase class I/II-fold pyridoxal phosphate-dependent enzyme [Elusimicrobiota bacterium]
MPPLEPFLLERYFARHEFSAKYLLSSSDCDGWALPEVLALADPEARSLWESLRLGYTESAGLPLLRAEIARLYSGVSPEEVFVAAPQEAIHLAMHALLNKGDHVVCAFPGYQSLYALAEAMGCEVSRWEPDENAGWRFDPERLRALLRPETRLIVVNFPHNPTGFLPSKEDFARVVALARERKITLFSDEMYRFLELDPKDRLPSACELDPKAVSLGGMSKAFGMAGIRVGWLIAQDPALRRRLAELKDYTTICGSAPSEVLALIGLRAKETILARHRERIARNLGLLDGFFRRQARAFGWIRPRAGSIGFAKLLLPEPPDAFCDRLVEKAGVMLLPSTVYGYRSPHVRFGFGRENMPEALARLEQFLS